MNRPTPRHILITGASGAIGSALAHQYSARFPDSTLSLVDNNKAGVRALAQKLGRRATPLVWDLSKPELLDAAWQDLMQQSGRVDLLVNCAGIMEIASFATTDWELGARLLAIDLTSPLRLMNLALKSMVAAGTGGVINVSSMAGRTPIRGCSYYGAAKSGLAMASEITRLEVRQANVHVLTGYPGPVASFLEKHARAQVKPTLVSRLLPTGDPAVLAEKIIRAFERRAPRVVYPDSYRLAYFFLTLSSWFTSRFSPTPLDRPPEKALTQGPS